MSTQDIFIFLAASLVLFYSGGAVVHSLTWFGRYSRVTEYLLALLLVAMATSLDELAIGISMILKDAPLASLGNLVGANVLNVTLILGEAILFADMERRRRRAVLPSLPGAPVGETDELAPTHTISRGDAVIILGMVLFPLFLLLDGTVSRLDGVLLILAFGGYVAYLLNEERIAETLHPAHEYFPGLYQMAPHPRRGGRDKYIVWARLLNAAEFNTMNFLKHVAVFTGGIVALLGSAWVMSSIGVDFAKSVGLPHFFIGILIALGTTLPEAVFNVRTIFMHHSSMALGNILGSVVVNTSLFLGIVALLHPITMPSIFPALFGMTLVAGFVLFTEVVSFLHVSFPRSLGVALILVSFLFIFLEYAF